MRKSCRWLGCAALMCFAALDLSGYSSESIEAGFKLPWRKDRNTASKNSVADKDTKLNAEQSTELLAKARAYERAGDFPNATRAYRQYLDAGGKPQPSGQQESIDDTVAQSGKKPSKKLFREKNNSVEDQPSINTDSRLTSQSTSRPSQKTRDPEFERTLGLSENGTSEDPWANQPEETNEAVAADTTENADAGSVIDGEQSSGLDAVVSSQSSGTSTSRATQESLDNLLDMDSGKLNWGDEPAEPASDLPADAGPASDIIQSDTSLTDAPLAEPLDEATTLPPQKTAEANLPMIDFNAKVDTEETSSPMIAEAQPADAPNEDWANIADDAAAPQFESVADTSTSSNEALDDLAPPIMEDEAPANRSVATKNSAAPEADSARSQSWPADEGVFTDVEANAPQSRTLAMKCKNCEPWIYAQVVKLDSADPEVRKEGLSRLTEMGRKAHPAASAVRATLKDNDPYVQAQAAWAWWEIEGDAFASVETLNALLKNSDANVVELACYILGDIGAPADATADALALLRDHSDGTTKVQAAEALIRIQGVDEKSLRVLTTAIKSKDGQVRWSAAVSLGRCRGGKFSSVAVSALTTALKDVDPEVRSAAALSLGGLGKDAAQATSELQRIASSDNPQVREAALAALACLKR